MLYNFVPAVLKIFGLIQGPIKQSIRQPALARVRARQEYGRDNGAPLARRSNRYY